MSSDWPVFFGNGPGGGHFSINHDKPIIAFNSRNEVDNFIERLEHFRDEAFGRDRTITLCMGEIGKRAGKPDFVVHCDGFGRVEFQSRDEVDSFIKQLTECRDRAFSEI